MRLVIIGHGAMGQLVYALAEREGHEINLIVDSKRHAQTALELADDVRGHDAAVDFSVASAVLRNAEACARAGVPLVEGTTGWHEEAGQVRRIVEAHDGALVVGANFSLGVNLFYRLAARAAELFAGFDAYAPFIEEAHHARKRDAPSGTALRLRELLAARYVSGDDHAVDISVASTRAGYIPGTHLVGFDSAIDTVTLTHTARTREGFAAGALVAARWIEGRRGVYEFAEVIDEMIAERTTTQT